MDLSQINDRLRAYGIEIQCTNCSSSARKISKTRNVRTVSKPHPNLLTRLQRSARNLQNFARKESPLSPLTLLNRRSFLNDASFLREGLGGFTAPEAFSPFGGRTPFRGEATPIATPLFRDSKSVKSTLYLTPFATDELSSEVLGPSNLTGPGALRVLDFECSPDWTTPDLPAFF